jgi:hypothetical protein
MPLTAARLLLLAPIVAALACGVLLSEHWHKVAASLGFGVAAGWLWRQCWRQVRKQSPALLEQAGKNVAEAQELLRDSFSWKLGAGRPGAVPVDSPGIEEVLADTISIVVLLCLAAMVWVLPVFREASNGGLALAKTAGAHLFALCCIAAATFGLLTRIAGKADGGL